MFILLTAVALHFTLVKLLHLIMCVFALAAERIDFGRIEFDRIDFG
jgi:hypothetical protein